jgi:hypothetical protein
VKIGPTEVVQKFDEMYEDYNDLWANRDESENYQQRHDTDMAKLEVMPSVEDQYKELVDAQIKMELENMKLIAGLKLPGFKAIRDIDKKDLLVQLIQNGIVKKLPP